MQRDQACNEEAGMQKIEPNTLRKRRPAISAVRLAAASFGGKEDLHAYLAAKLRFPDYYGGNLAALNDCLGDICKPTAIFVLRTDDDPEWFTDACRVMQRAAGENPSLLFAWER